MGVTRTPSQQGGAGGIEGVPNPIDWYGGGQEIFRWNGVDLSQFDVVNILRFRDGLGNPTAGDVTPAVAVGAGYRGENWLTFTASIGWRGGWLMRLITDPLPERYFMWVRFVRGNLNTEGGLVLAPFGIESPGAPGFFEGCLFQNAYTGQNDYPVHLAHLAGANPWTQLYWDGITPIYNQKTILNPQPGFLDVQGIGGIQSSIQVRRQTAADNPTANWWWRTNHTYDSGAEHWFQRMGVQTRRDGVAAPADPAPYWNGLDMDQAFVGYYSFNALVGGQFIAISDLRIYEWNPAAPGT